MIGVARLVRETGAGVILGGDRAQAQRADIAPPGELGLGEHFAPGIERAAAKGRRDVAAAVERGDAERIAEPVEAERARQADDMAAIDEAAAEAPLALAVLVEMDLGAVLVEPRRHRVLGLLDGHAVDMIDALALGVVAPAMRRPGQHAVVAREVESLRHDQRLRRYSVGELRYARRRRRRGGIALPHHHPAHVVDDRRAALVETLRADINRAGLTVRVLAQADHFRARRHRVARVGRRAAGSGGPASRRRGNPRRSGRDRFWTCVTSRRAGQASLSPVPAEYFLKPLRLASGARPRKGATDELQP